MSEPSLIRSRTRNDVDRLAEEPSQDVRMEWAALDAKIKAILPERYRHCYNLVRPISMGTAELKFGDDGKVAWNEIWTSFCDLALAGGPPHRGTFLGPASSEEVEADPESYRKVVEEIGRGFWLTTGLPVLLRSVPGQILVRCRSASMAHWLVRAINAENVFARHDAEMLALPAGPRFRLASEIKNVITALAKTCHYWTDHMNEERRSFETAALPQPATAEEALSDQDRYRLAADALARGIREGVGFEIAPERVLGWIGARCPDQAAAVWLLRALNAENLIARREADVLYLPVSPEFTPDHPIRTMIQTLRHVWKIHLALPASRFVRENA